MRHLTGLLLAGTLVYGVAAPATAKDVCVIAIVYYDPNKGCANTCLILTGLLPSWKELSGTAGAPNLVRPIPPALTVPPAPTKITSCQQVERIGNNSNYQCTAKICGPSSYSDTLHSNGIRRVPRVAVPGVASPGLLEGDSGIAQQGPAPAGTATGGTYRGR